MSVTVDIRKATLQTGYLLSVTRTYPNGKGGQVYPGPRCSNLKTAREVAVWIESHLPPLAGESV